MSVCVKIENLLDESVQRRVWYRADGFPDGSAFYKGGDGVLYIHHFHSPGEMLMKVNKIVALPFDCPECICEYVRDTFGLDPDILEFSPVAKQEFLFEEVRDKFIL